MAAPGTDESIASRLELLKSGVPSKRTLALITVAGQFFKIISNFVAAVLEPAAGNSVL